MTKTMGIAVAALVLSAPAAAQDQTAAALETRMQVERARVSVESRVTTGAPYSGEAVTETLQVLGDGNRISRRSVSRIYRDSEGRTRRETLSQTGDVVNVSISDPVAGTQYVLDPRNKTAVQNRVMVMSGRGGGFSVATVAPSGYSGESVRAARTAEGTVTVTTVDAETKRKQEVELTAQAAASAGGGGRGRGGAIAAVSPAGTPPLAASTMASAGNAVKEELGAQIVEGVMATGSRATTTIAAGAIGNVQPIHVVSEQWFSDDLKVLVMTRHSDPRSGDTTYRLTNIVLAEPSKTLFEVPADYTLKEATIRRENPLK
jgi:hypothetical protein